MPINSMHSYDLRYQRLSDPSISWYEARQIVNYFVSHEAERGQVGASLIAWELFNLALHKDGLVRDEAVSGLAQLEQWEELGLLACIWIDPNRELKRHSSISTHHFSLACYLNPDAIAPLGWALERGLQKPINTDALWSAVRKFFRRKDETMHRRAIHVIKELHIAPAYPTLKRLIEDPEKAELHAEAVEALGGIGDDRAVRYLVCLLENPDLRRDALYALQDAASPKAVRGLKKLLATEPPSNILAQILNALGASGGDTAARALLKYAKPPYTLRVTEALGETGSDVAVPKLKSILRGRKSTDQERESAAEALSKIDTEASRKVLAETLSGSNKKAASFAGAALRARQDDY